MRGLFVGIRSTNACLVLSMLAHKKMNRVRAHHIMLNLKPSVLFLFAKLDWVYVRAPSPVAMTMTFLIDLEIENDAGGESAIEV